MKKWLSWMIVLICLLMFAGCADEDTAEKSDAGVFRIGKAIGRTQKHRPVRRIRPVAP